MGIYILGMHRSGTSALAGMVSALTGLPASRLAVSSNPLGQWERSELQPALELLLASHRKTWAHPPEPSEKLSARPVIRTYANRVFAKNCSGPFLWKDPRLCLTIDHWLALPQERARIIFIHREPVAVAASLTRRNGWSLERGLALWERTNRNAIERLAGHPVYCLSHDTLMADPAGAASRLAQWLGLAHDDQRLKSAVEMISPPTAAASDTAVQANPAMQALHQRLCSILGDSQLSLDGLPPETSSTGRVLGQPGTTELGRRAARAVQSMFSNPNPEVASASFRKESW